MWFDDNSKNNCSNCKYGNRDITCKQCDNCFLTYTVTGQKYVNWQKEERGKYYDLFVQWYAWLGQIFTYCKGYLLQFKKRLSSRC